MPHPFEAAVGVVTGGVGNAAGVAMKSRKFAKILGNLGVSNEVRDKILDIALSVTITFAALPDMAFLFSYVEMLEFSTT